MAQSTRQLILCKASASVYTVYTIQSIQYNNIICVFSIYRYRHYGIHRLCNAGNIFGAGCQDQSHNMTHMCKFKGCQVGLTCNQDLHKKQGMHAGKSELPIICSLHVEQRRKMQDAYPEPNDEFFVLATARFCGFQLPGCWLSC